MDCRKLLRGKNEHVRPDATSKTVRRINRARHRASQPDKAQRNPPSLLTLPKEIRLEIYRLVFRDETLPLDWEDLESETLWLLEVNSLVCAEAMPIFYQSITFEITNCDVNFATETKFRNRIPHILRCGKRAERITINKNHLRFIATHSQCFPKLKYVTFNHQLSWFAETSAPDTVCTWRRAALYFAMVNFELGYER